MGSPVIVFGDHTRAIKYVDFPFAMGADGTKVLAVNAGYDPRFVYHCLRSQPIPSVGYSRHFKFLKELSVPAFPFDEQCRIAAILDQADAIRAKRRQVLDHLDGLAKSVFHEMFGGCQLRSAPLSELAEVTSGITKGRRTSASTSAVPFLAVANVQDGSLKMGIVKEIEATAAEVQRFALKDGDLVLTEGGDPDKLGRGTVWRNELPLCIHQNHIFRVRIVDALSLLPDYLSSFVASPSVRSYFLGSAKQTTGIASINVTQLRALPVAVPPIDEQKIYVDRLRTINAQRARVESALAADDELFASLQSRAFKGEL